ncbi:hypothetical protein CC86DRAFT_272924, partial [Ophiobolus disseminans]
MLDQSHHISKIIFKSESGLRAALEFYLSYPTMTRGMHSIKTVIPQPGNPMPRHHLKLEHLARLLGSELKAKYHVQGTIHNDMESTFDDTVFGVLEMMKDTVVHDPFESPIIVLTKVLLKLEVDVLSMHALDELTKVDGCPSYPGLVFQAVH